MYSSHILEKLELHNFFNLVQCNSVVFNVLDEELATVFIILRM